MLTRVAGLLPRNTWVAAAIGVGIIFVPMLLVMAVVWTFRLPPSELGINMLQTTGVFGFIWLTLLLTRLPVKPKQSPLGRIFIVMIIGYCLYSLWAIWHSPLPDWPDTYVTSGEPSD